MGIPRYALQQYQEHLTRARWASGEKNRELDGAFTFSLFKKIAQADVTGVDWLQIISAFTATDSTY